MAYHKEPANFFMVGDYFKWYNVYQIMAIKDGEFTIKFSRPHYGGVDGRIGNIDIVRYGVMISADLCDKDGNLLE